MLRAAVFGLRGVILMVFFAARLSLEEASSFEFGLDAPQGQFYLN
jgi:hypothetical protein